MELLQLRYFCTVARLEHMTKAAIELKVAQPSLSKMIKKLEGNLGVDLFERKGKHIYLNDFGRVFYRHASDALKTLEDAKHEIHEMSSEKHSIIRLVIGAGYDMTTDLLAGFSRDYPNVRFELQHNSHYVNIMDFDFCITARPSDYGDVRAECLMSEEILLAVPDSHPYAGRQSITLGEIASDRFITLRKGTSFRETTDYFCRNDGFEPDVLFEIDDPTAILGLVESGTGVAFVPSLSWGDMQKHKFSVLKISSFQCSRKIYLITSTIGYMTEIRQLFTRYTIDYYRTITALNDINTIYEYDLGKH